VSRPTAVALAAFLALPLATPARADSPFNGKDLTGWKFKGDAKNSKWVVGVASVDPKSPAGLVVAKPTEGATPELINAGSGVNLYTEQEFGDCVIDLEFMYPKGSNSGVYVLGEYEVQIYDTAGQKERKKNENAAIYQISAPKVDASKPAGEWQRLTIDFRAPKFDASGKKTANARFVKVTLNGQVIHEDVEAPGVTPSGLTGKEHATGPLFFQGDHGPVAFRKISVTSPR
jgi:hypothetical protein